MKLFVLLLTGLPKKHILNLRLTPDHRTLLATRVNTNRRKNNPNFKSIKWCSAGIGVQIVNAKVRDRIGAINDSLF